MDEECLRPGDPNDKTLLAKLNDKLSYHDHYISHYKADIKLQKIMGRDVRTVQYRQTNLGLNGFCFVTGISANSLRRRRHV